MKLKDFINRVKDSTKTTEVREAAASGLHDLRRRPLLKDDGSFNANIVATTDKKWIERTGSDQFDLSNTSFSNLPEDWRSEFLEEVKVLEEAYSNHKLSIEDVSTDKKNRLFIGAIIHETMLDRLVEKDSAVRRYPFNKLSATDKNKYVRQYILYLEIRKSIYK